ncbi:MAG: PAS domain S-box protein [Acetobacterales bacterium]
MIPDASIAPDLLAPTYLDLTDEILVGIAPDGRVLHINKAGAEILGRREAEIVGKDWFRDFLPERHRQAARDIFRKLVNGEADATQRAENPVLRADGTERIIAWHNRAVRDAAGRLVAVLASGEDVTEQRASEAALRESERRFRATFEQTPVGIAHVGRNGRFLRLNDKLCEITGYGRAELEKLTFQDITVPADLEADLSLARALWAGEIPDYRLEKRYVRKDGSVVWIALTASLVRDESGLPEYGVAVVEDIDRRKQAESVRANEELQRMALSAAGAGAWEWDAAAGRQMWSPELYELFGAEAAEGPPDIPSFLLRHVHPDDRGPLERSFRKAAASGRDCFRAEYRAQHPELGIRRIETIGRLFHDSGGKLLRAYGISLDVTENWHIKQALRESEERLRLAMAAGQIGVWDWDILSGRVNWSDDQARLAGMRPGEFAGTVDAFRALVHPEDREAVEEAIRAALAGEVGDYALAFRMILPDGGIRWSETRATVMRDEAGQPVRMIGIDMDVTERAAAAELQQRLIGELDHRVHNIIAVIRAVAARTLDAGPQLDAFAGRLTALSRAHALLAGAGWGSADLGDLLGQVLAAHAPDRITVAGPVLPLSPKGAQTMALTLHELATNAAKYGALSGDAGQLRVAWCLSGNAADGDADRMLHIDWIETGGPSVSPPERQGFGTRLIRQTLQFEGGEAELRFLPGGLEARLRVPTDRLVCGPGR